MVVVKAAPNEFKIKHRPDFLVKTPRADAREPGTSGGAKGFVDLTKGSTITVLEDTTVSHKLNRLSFRFSCAGSDRLGSTKREHTSRDYMHHPGPHENSAKTKKRHLF